jgi:hypothetical protein
MRASRYDWQMATGTDKEALMTELIYDVTEKAH